MAKTRAQENRAIRQEALREQLAAKGLTQKALDDIDKIRELADIELTDYDNEKDFLADMSAARDKAAIIKMALDGRFKLIGKYLPDLKQQEFVGEGGKELPTVPVLFTSADVDGDEVEADNDSNADT